MVTDRNTQSRAAFGMLAKPENEGAREEFLDELSQRSEAERVLREIMRRKRARISATGHEWSWLKEGF